MAKCDVCGNDYHLSFQVLRAGETHTFDCFECAISRLAPTCHHCGCRIIGHGMEATDKFFCCAHCARQSGATDLKDHAGASEPSRDPTPRVGTAGGHLL